MTHICSPPTPSPLVSLPDVCATAVATSLGMHDLRRLMQTCKEALATYRACVSGLSICAGAFWRAIPREWDDARLYTAMTSLLPTLPHLTKAHFERTYRPTASPSTWGCCCRRRARAHGSRVCLWSSGRVTVTARAAWHGGLPG